jgi:hypothetical protein
MVNGLEFEFEKLFLAFLWTFENYISFKIHLGLKNREYGLGPKKK